jgi:hypothetical protein
MIDVKWRWKLVLLLHISDKEMWCKREPSFVENHMSRDNDKTSLKFHAMVATMVRRITKKYTCGRVMRQFMGHGGGKVWIAQTTKSAK